ncbi:hypothetical protein HK103_006124 [Boothiomyces macroporosus]|uniref:HMG box domain-containing protein n=1 Tax=Boothiomyces macroporosus TaxID=261099 RepID=A0AAD5Y2V3_9FUNG|nr:hypothetical protein HK103_006124 [Boothiomyces macroporosus]
MENQEKAEERKPEVNDQEVSDAENDPRDKEKKKNYVKKPLNSFFLYRRAMRDKIIKKYNITKSHEISKMAGDCWALEPESVKQKYQKLAQEEYSKHKETHPEYKWPSRNDPKRKANKQKVPTATKKVCNPNEPVAFFFGSSSTLNAKPINPAQFPNNWGQQGYYNPASPTGYYNPASPTNSMASPTTGFAYPPGFASPTAYPASPNPMASPMASPTMGMVSPLQQPMVSPTMQMASPQMQMVSPVMQATKVFLSPQMDGSFMMINQHGQPQNAVLTPQPDGSFLMLSPRADIQPLQGLFPNNNNVQVKKEDPSRPKPAPLADTLSPKANSGTNSNNMTTQPVLSPLLSPLLSPQLKAIENTLSPKMNAIDNFLSSTSPPQAPAEAENYNFDSSAFALPPVAQDLHPSISEMAPHLTSLFADAYPSTEQKSKLQENMVQSNIVQSIKGESLPETPNGIQQNSTISQGMHHIVHNGLTSQPNITSIANQGLQNNINTQKISHPNIPPNHRTAQMPMQTISSPTHGQGLFDNTKQIEQNQFPKPSEDISNLFGEPDLGNFNNLNANGSSDQTNNFANEWSFDGTLFDGNS